MKRERIEERLQELELLHEHTKAQADEYERLESELEEVYYEGGN